MTKKLGSPFAARRRPTLAGAAFLALAAFLACDGDTLYESGASDVPPPDVAIVRPVTGSDAQAGRQLPVRIVASDSLGISQIELVYSGVTAGVIRFTFAPPRLTVSLDTVIALAPGATGQLEMKATGRNGRGAIGRSEAVIVRVAAQDTVIPTVALEVQAPQRAELTDTIRVRVIAADNDGGSGIVRLGMTALVRVGSRPDTLVLEQVAPVSPPASGTVAREFRFLPPFVDERTVPADLTFEFHGWAIDEAGNCAAAVKSPGQRLRCLTYRDAAGDHTVAAAVADRFTTRVVRGRSVVLPTASSIMDAVPDISRQRLYLSNLGRNRLEVLDLATRTFRAPVTVGSQPWGLALNRTGDTLFVANSGGTNVSAVTLAGTPAEVVGNRIRTPNAALFTVERQIDITMRERLQIRFLDFSDRPQFIAQDAFGRLLYSTLPTLAAPDGTIRVAENVPGWEQPEVRILIGRGVFEADSTNISILNVDSMRVFSFTGGSDRIEIYDHRNGFPSQIIRSGILPLDSAIAVLVNNPESDIVWAPGRYVLELIGLSERVFVAASGDRTRVAFGEGVRRTGRIIVWNANTASISNEITVADLVNNASERILGIDLNTDGTLGAARGDAAAYFFNDGLRLQGRFEAPVPSGGSGTSLHPFHPSYASFPPPSPNALAFVADATAVRIVDTIHFAERGRIEVRDVITGPLRVSPALPGDNPPGCAGPECVVAKLYGVTAAGAVVVIDVRGRDIS